MIKLFDHIYLYVFMLAMASQTAGPNGLKFFEGTKGVLGSNLSNIFFSKIRIYFNQNFIS